MNGQFGWAPKDGDIDSAHLQIDLGTLHSIYAIATQGNDGAKEWVTSYKLEFSLDDTVWTFYKEGSAAQVRQSFNLSLGSQLN